MTYVGTRTYSHLIITPDMRTFGADTYESQAAALREEAASREQQASARGAQNARREEAVRSRGSENMHMEHRYVVVDIRHHADATVGSAKLLENIAALMRNVDAKQADIDREAHEKISTAKTSVEIETIIAEYHSWAAAFSLSAANEIGTMMTRWGSTHGAAYSGVASRSIAAVGHAPMSPPTPNPSPGIVKPLDEKTRKHQKDGTATDSRGAEQVASDNPVAKESPAQDSRSKAQEGSPTRGAALGGERGEAVSVPTQTPSRLSTPSPLGSGGVPSGGGSSGGGLGSGLGSSPLSSLGGGLGQSPAGGLGSGLSSTNPAASAASSSGSAVNPGSAFARGFSSASSVVPPPVAPAPAGAGSAPLVAGPASVPPVTGVAGGGPVAAAGAHGMVTPATTAGGAGGSASQLPLLPSPGMGAPAAAGATASVAPVSSSSTAPATSGGSSSTGSATAPTGNVGPTLVPAAVVSAVDPERAVRGLSPDAKAAALLAWRLWHDCREVGWPVNWVVGVFRSSEGAETVVHSTEGSGYVPANVHVPRGVRLLVADDLVGSDFRKKWFGWADPVEVLAEYASLRQGHGWHLVAAAVVGVAGNRQALDRQVEFVSCSIDDSPHKQGDPVAELDQMHVHRLQLEYPDLYDRLERLSANAGQAVVDPLIRPLTQHLVDVALGIAVERFESTEFRDALRDQWRQVRAASPDQPAPSPEELAEMWDPFTQLVITTFRSGALLQPGKYPGLKPEDDQESAQEYRKAWLVARALEAVAGWAGWPQYRISLPGIVYAAAAVEPESDFREKLNPSLHTAEAAMGW